MTADENAAKSKGYTALRDIYYTKDNNERQSYDLFIPGEASGSTGLILCIHGGGWNGGGKADYLDAPEKACAEKRHAAAAMNYRYVSESTGFGDILDDISSALSSIKEQGKRYGVNFDRVLLTGISAGGPLSLLYAYTRKETAPVKPVCVVELCGPADFEDPFYYSEENSISKAVGSDYFRNLIYNGIGFRPSQDDKDGAGPLLRKYSPVNYIGKDSVPTVFGHGENDEIVPYRNSLDLDAKLTECGVEHTFISFPGSGHGCEDRASIKKIMELFFSCADRFL